MAKPNKAFLKAKGCVGKVQYKSKKDALKAINGLHKAAGYQGNLHPYRCQFCGKYHFGHKRA
jgi:hypothetical protein